MNKNESRYFSTAAKMDQAFLELLAKKDFSYITVKEICQKAGVNRSTFYLHYETLEDLLLESVEYMNEQFLSYMKKDSGDFVAKISESPPENQQYILSFYIHGIMAVIADWLKQDCKDSPEHIAVVLQQCIRQPQ